jgi:hypothetical protein
MVGATRHFSVGNKLAAFGLGTRGPNRQVVDHIFWFEQRTVGHLGDYGRL